uniref:Uncharacterized protein n=1 Tax=Arundo donax TaxID=35708 RepID=A0A0A9CCM8_ARUDO
MLIPPLIRCIATVYIVFCSLIGSDHPTQYYPGACSPPPLCCVASAYRACVSVKFSTYCIDGSPFVISGPN